MVCHTPVTSLADLPVLAARTLPRLTWGRPQTAWARNDHPARDGAAAGEGRAGLRDPRRLGLSPRPGPPEEPAGPDGRSQALHRARL
jgi:hypothetical protein